MIKKRTLFVSVMLALTLLSGCHRNELDTPCPDYGRHCAKYPINSWDFKH